MARRKKPPPFIFWWVKADCESEFGPIRTPTMKLALEEWEIVTAPNAKEEPSSEYKGVCVYHEPTSTVYVWPDHFASAENPERLAKKILKGGGFKVDEVVRVLPYDCPPTGFHGFYVSFLEQD